MLNSLTTCATSRFPPDEALRTFEELDAPEGVADRLVRVATARVVLLDHDLLAHDLPALSDQALAAAGHDPANFRESWFLENAGLISTAQAAQSLVNTPIRAKGPPRDAWRPPRYGRASVVTAAGPDGTTLLLDIKGAGRGPGQSPSLAHHASGLCSLREALREALFEALISAIFARAAPDLWTLPVYGVIDLGFDARTHRGEVLPAGLLVRRAHRRSIDDVTLPWRGTSDERLRLEVELLLRAYGVTSANAGTRFRLEAGADGPRLGYRDATPAKVDAAIAPAACAILGDASEAYCDGINVQLVRRPAGSDGRAQLVDFGHYEVRRRFGPAVVSMVRNAPHLWGASIGPSDPGFVQPHPVLHAPLAKWAREEEVQTLGGAPRAAIDPPTRWVGEMAQAFRDGRIAGEEIEGAIRSFARWD